MAAGARSNLLSIWWKFFTPEPPPDPDFSCSCPWRSTATNRTSSSATSWLIVILVPSATAWGWPKITFSFRLAIPRFPVLPGAVATVFHSPKATPNWSKRVR